MKKPVKNILATHEGRWAALFALAVVVAAGLTLTTGVTKTESSPFAETLSPEAGTLIISEFRLRGPGGVSDEFIEIYNNTNSNHIVVAASGTGYGIAASDGNVRCSITNGTNIPARGHFLCANTGAYSLSGYPAGNGTTANPDATYTSQIPDNVGIALFNNNSGGASFSLANRFDAAGSTAEANSTYREGTGHPTLNVNSLNFCLFRKYDAVTGHPADTDNNVSDFLFTDPTAGFILGAPGPQNLSSPVFGGAGTFSANPIDGTRAISAGPNRNRDVTSDPGNNSSFGTISVRRRFVNNTGGSITRLRFRILDISTLPQVADLRARNSTSVVVGGVNDAATCLATGAPSTPPCTATVQGTTLETPPAQALGGGFNSSMSAGTVTLATPLANGASINLQFLFGIEAQGGYHLLIALEALPSGGALFEVSGSTLAPNASSDTVNRVSDFDGDGKTDVSVYRPSTGVWHLSRSTAGVTGFAWGISTDKIVPADYGDGKTDVAVYRPSEGRWYIFNSATSTVTQPFWGNSTDIPAPGDYDGDFKADVAIFRPSDGNWWLSRSTAGTLTTQFGQNADIPVVGDYDRDGESDIAVFRPSNGTWFVRRSTAGDIGYAFGFGTDKVVPADYDGDGRTDIAVWRPTTGQWFIANSGSPTFVTSSWGASTDIPTPGDYDGDGRADIAIFRPSDGNWWLNRTTAGSLTTLFGQNGDKATPNAFGN